MGSPKVSLLTLMTLIDVIVDRLGLSKGHLKTTWTKFYPILTTSPLEWTIVDFLLTIYLPLLVHVVI